VRGPDGITAEDAPTTVDVQEVITHDGQPIPPELVPAHPAGGAIEEPIGPRVVTENENVRLEDDGSVSRRVARVEHEPAVRRRRPTIVPALLIILALALGAIAAAWYFSQSDTKAVPGVEGLALDDAVTRLQDDGFKADITSQPNGAAQGIVFRQNPGAGTDLDEGSTVLLLVSKGPADVTVPNAVGISEAEARDRLVAAGLKTTAVQVFSERPAGEVVAQSPAAGGKAAKESLVRINVSKGTELVTVPSLVGTSQNDATAQLKTAGLEANIVSVPSTEPAGTVVAQHPTAGQARRGSAVRLNVSTGS
jgi:serine/threonine-protein kinase